MELSSSNIQKILIKESFSYIYLKESFSYISQNGTLYFSAQAERIKQSNPRKLLCFRKRKPLKISYVQETETLKTFYILGSNFQSLKSLELFIFEEETLKSQKQTKNLLRRNFLSVVTFL